MKKIVIGLLLFFGWALDAEQLKIGEEYIEPLKYPKFSIGAEYPLGGKFKKLEAAKSFEDVSGVIGGMLSLEAGLYKYLNGGAIFFVNFPGTKDPLRLRLTLFAKPYISLGERCAVFARIGGGIGGWVVGGLPGATTNALASLGFEFFPFSRFGIALEAGWRAEILFINSRENPDKENGVPKRDLSFYFAHEIPFSLNFHIIL